MYVSHNALRVVFRFTFQTAFYCHFSLRESLPFWRITRNPGDQVYIGESTRSLIFARYRYTWSIVAPLHTRCLCYDLTLLLQITRYI